MGRVRRARSTLTLVVTVLLLEAIGAATCVPAPGWSEADASGWTSQGFQLRAEPRQLVVSPVIPVIIECTLRNVGRGGVRISESYPEHDYRLEVRDAQGRLIPATGSATTTYRNVSRELQAGEQITDQYRLNRMYLLADAGDYTITGKRFVYRREGKGVAEVVSNPIVLRVAADPVAGPAFPSGDWGPVTEDAQLRIEVMPVVVRPRAALLLRLNMENVTSQVLRIAEGTQLHDYRLSIIDADGEEVSVARDCMHVEEGQATAREVGPWDAVLYEYDLNKKYDFVEPGEYTITARRRVPRLDGEGSTWVESNAVLLTVSEEL